MLKSKVVKAVTTGVVGLSVVATLWTGGDIIQRGIDFITGADAKIEQAVSNISLLKSGITTKNEQIATLKAEIESLKEQIANNEDASQEQLTQLQEQLNNKIAEVERLTQENTTLKGELDKANKDAEKLKVALDSSTFNDVVIDSTEEIQAFINGGEATSPEEENSIVWSVTGSEQNKSIAQSFIDATKDTIESHLKGLGVNLKGISIQVEGAYEMSGTNYVKMYVSGASEEAKTEITKNKLNAVIGSKNSIETLLYR